MKISTKGRYGVRILLDLASHRNVGRPRLLREIAESQELSEKYVSRLILELRDAGLVESSRGAKGGYAMAKSPAEISLLEIVELMEGAIKIVDCVGVEKAECQRCSFCQSKKFWEKINVELRRSLARYTLQDLIDEDVDDEKSKGKIYEIADLKEAEPTSKDVEESPKNYRDKQR